MKNYTSTVPVERTISRIEQILAKAGAQSVAKSYKDGVVVSMSFILVIPGRGPCPIRLPANAEAVARVLKAEVRKPQAGTLERIDAQAARTAWRIMEDWVSVQMSLIEMGQAEPLQVFLSYIQVGRGSYYDFLKCGGFKALPEGQKEG